MRVLALDAALARCSAAVVVDQQPVAVRQQDAARGHAALLPVMADALLPSIPTTSLNLGLTCNVDLVSFADDIALLPTRTGPGAYADLVRALQLVTAWANSKGMIWGGA